MSTFLQVVIIGLGRGAVYALLALGFVIIYKATETVNFATAPSRWSAATWCSSLATAGGCLGLSRR